MVAPTIIVSLLNAIFLPTLTDSIFLSFVENHVQIAHDITSVLQHSYSRLSIVQIQSAKIWISGAPGLDIVLWSGEL